MLTPKQIAEIENKIQSGMSVGKACGSDRVRMAYRRHKKGATKKEKICSVLSGSGIVQSLATVKNIEVGTNEELKKNLRLAANSGLKVSDSVWGKISIDILKCTDAEFQKKDGKKVFTPDDYANMWKKLMLGE